MKKYELQTYGKNELKRVAKIEIENILPQLIKYVGKQIETQSGFSKKFVINKVEPKPIPMAGGFATLQLCYLRRSYESLCLELSICLSGGKYEDKTYYCQYFQRSFHIANMDRFNLTEVLSFEQVVNNNHLDEVIDLDIELAKIEKLKLLEAEVSKLKYSIKIDI